MPTLALYGLYVLCFLGVIYLGLKVIDPGEGAGHDFRVIWVAGKMWLNAADPYSQQYFEYQSRLLGNDRTNFFWAYPPNWTPISMLFGSLSFFLADNLWRLINFAAIFATIFLCYELVSSEIDIQKRRHTLLIGAIFFFFLQATPMALLLGQTTLVVTLGLVLWIYGTSKNKPALAAFGVFLMLLKPQIAIIPLSAMIFSKVYRKSILNGIGLAVLASTMSFYIIGIPETVLGFLEKMNGYHGPNMNANGPDSMTGIAHLYNIVFYESVGTVVLAAIGILVGGTIGYFWQKKLDRDEPATNLQIIQMSIFLISLITVVIPLHQYDFVILAPVALFAMLARGWARIFIGLGLILVFRAGNVADIFSAVASQSASFPGSLILSIASILILIGTSIPVVSFLRKDLILTSARRN